jgi:hypothetical protein
MSLQITRGKLVDPAATMDKLVDSVTTALDELDPQATTGDVFTDVAAVDSQTGHG